MAKTGCHETELENRMLPPKRKGRMFQKRTALIVSLIIVVVVLQKEVSQQRAILGWHRSIIGSLVAFVYLRLP